jgi:DNA-binding XRE family transcriptional regulator
MSNARTAETVTITRAQHQAFLEMQARLEDIEDRLAGAKAIEDYHADPTSFLPVDMVKRILAGEAPVRIWRERRGLKATELAQATGLTSAYISEIENGKKPGSIDAFRKLARALGVTVDDLLPA